MKTRTATALIALCIGTGCASKDKREADAQRIIEAYKEQKIQVKECYESALKEKPDLAGEVTLKWVVDRRGKLKRAKIEKSDMQDEPFHKCLLAHLKSVSFPGFRSVSTIEVDYTLSFSK